MKKRIISFALVLAMIMSVSVAAYASDGIYTYTVKKTGVYLESSTVSRAPVVHSMGTVDTINCTVGGTYYFDFDQLDSAYRVGLTQAYYDAGLKSHITVPTYTSWTIPSTSASGVYTLVLNLNYARGTWDVKYGTNQGPFGNFTASPVSYSIQLVH